MSRAVKKYTIRLSEDEVLATRAINIGGTVASLIRRLIKDEIARHRHDYSAGPAGNPKQSAVEACAALQRVVLDASKEGATGSIVLTVRLNQGGVTKVSGIREGEIRLEM